MKVMLVNGFPHVKGNTFLALEEMRKIFARALRQNWCKWASRPFVAASAAGNALRQASAYLMIL